MADSHLSKTDFHNILIIKLGALGDVVMAEGAMHDIRRHHPEAKITIMTTPPYEKMLNRCPWADEVIIDPREPRYRLDRMLALRNRLRGYNFDLVYDLQQVGRTGFYYTWIWGRSIPWFGKVRGCTHYAERNPDTPGMDNLALSLKKVSVPTKYTLKSDVSWMADDVSDILASYQLKKKQYVVLVPGCSANHPQKRWPYYGELARKLLDLGLRVATVPGPDEMELCRAIPGDMLLCEGSFLDYFKLAGVLAQAKYIIGNDTGPTHIGANLRKPGLVLFGNHVPAVNTGIQHTLFKWLEVESLADLSVEAVFKTFQANLNCQDSP